LLCIKIFLLTSWKSFSHFKWHRQKTRGGG
jgi:hypothetical protein